MDVVSGVPGHLCAVCSFSPSHQAVSRDGKQVMCKVALCVEPLEKEEKGNVFANITSVK